MDATGKIFQISKFPNTLSFVTISGMFRRNFTRIGEIYIYPINSFEVVVFHPRSNKIF